MPSVLRQLSAGLPDGQRQQWTSHQGARQRARNLKRLRDETLREQRAQCDWLSTTVDVPAAPVSEDAR
jgi:hypothetical protein